MDYIVHTDGSCWPNPGGPIGYGFTIKSDGGHWEHANRIDAAPSNTNNVAEFAALYEALAYAGSEIAIGPGDKFICYSDSQIMVNLMNDLYRPNPEKSYYQNYSYCKDIVNEFKKNGASLEFHWIPREQNQECDDLSKAFQPPKQKVVSEAVLRRAKRKMRKDLALKTIKSEKPVDIWQEMEYSGTNG